MCACLVVEEVGCLLEFGWVKLDDGVLRVCSAAEFSYCCFQCFLVFLYIGDGEVKFCKLLWGMG